MPGLSDKVKVANLTICCETRNEADVRNYPWSRHLWYFILPTEEDNKYNFEKGQQRTIF